MRFFLICEKKDNFVGEKNRFIQMMRRQCLVLCIALCAAVSVFGQSVNTKYLRYIDTYKEMAVDQMLRYKIPASITLAQGLLESGAGESYLARVANNHFGIKCGSSWKGPYVRQDDDARNEKFRKYKSVAESYEDHSLFLKQPRYASLFKYSTRNYKDWAHGLKRCGYATNPRYGYLLIDLIERYDLDQYDRWKSVKQKYDNSQLAEDEEAFAHLVYFNNDNYYIIARAGDTFKSLAAETGVSARNIRKYNELPKGYAIQEGDVLYLERKRKRASESYEGRPHVVQPGESMYTIAQRYGIRMESLYKMNDLPDDYAAAVNDVLRVR